MCQPRFVIEFEGLELHWLLILVQHIAADAAYAVLWDVVHFCTDPPRDAIRIGVVALDHLVQEIIFDAPRPLCQERKHLHADWK